MARRLNLSRHSRFCPGTAAGRVVIGAGTPTVRTANNQRVGIASRGSAATSRPPANSALWLIRTGWVYIEIDHLHAALRLSMAGAHQPRSITESGVAHFRQE